MIKARSLFRAALLLIVGTGLSGCPMVLEDDFSSKTMSSAGNDGRGGRGGLGGTTDDAGEPGTGATPGGGMTTAGSAGSHNQSGADAGGSLTGGSGAGADAGAGGEGGALPVEPCADCPAEECCEGVCVNLDADENNCGVCGTGCPGTICDSASCTNTCSLPFANCNQNLVDGCEVNPAIDPNNCGNCGTICGFGLECVEGYCICPAGTADCDGKAENGCEADLSSDKANCNGCGKPCSAGQACGDGSCDCSVGFLECNQQAEDGCESLVTASTSCGSCALDCGLHGICVMSGQCGCQTGYLDCDPLVAGCETPINDPNHCGGCGVDCPASLPACNGVQCITGCGALTACGASCVDTQVNPENCGGCGKPVGLNQTCVAGKPECVTGYADCDGDPKTCEAATQTDGANCGVCGNVCKAGALCQSGSCGCAPGTPNDCGSTCQKCCNDGQCSDGDSCTSDVCSNGSCSSSQGCAAGSTCCSGTGCFACCSDQDCTDGKVCSGNQCITLTCTAPQIACALTCVNPTNDAKNCGGCGNQCGVGRTCSNSACTPKWVPTASPLAGFVAREKAAYTAMGSQVFIWGGNDASGNSLATGAVYDAATNTWTAVASAGTPPSARVLATAVWTGSVVVVWGGGNASASADYTSGGRYDPATNTWQAISTVGAPAGRRGAYGFWTGSRVLFWGGVDRQGNPTATASLYDPVNDRWYATRAGGQPMARTDAVVGWSGSQLLIYGGRVGDNSEKSTYTYTLATDAWARVGDGPSDRYGALGTWDGTLLMAWSGYDGAFKNDGRLYEPVANRWTTVQAMGQPSARLAINRQTGWSSRLKPNLTLVLGGYGNGGTYLTNGGIYNSTTNSWTSVGAWPSGNSHLWGVAVWTGSEVVLWGGRTGTGSTLTSSGERLLP